MPTGVSSMPSLSERCLCSTRNRSSEWMSDIGQGPAVSRRSGATLRGTVGEVLYFLGDDLLGGAVRVFELRIGEQSSAAALRSASGRRHSTIVSRRMASRNARSRSADRCRRMTEHSRMSPLTAAARGSSGEEGSDVDSRADEAVALLLARVLGASGLVFRPPARAAGVRASAGSARR